MYQGRQQIIVPTAVFCLSVGAASIGGVWSAISAFAAGLAVLLPDLMHNMAMKRISALRPRDAVKQILRNRLLRFISTVVFLAVGLNALGGNIVVLAWLIAMLLQVALPPVLVLAQENKDRD